MLKKNGDWMELDIVVNYPYYADLAQIFESGDCTDKGAALISAHMLVTCKTGLTDCSEAFTVPAEHFGSSSSLITNAASLS